MENIQNTKQVQIISKSEAKKLLHRGELRYLRKATFFHEVRFASMAESAESSDLERAALDAFAQSHRADVLVVVEDKSAVGCVTDHFNRVYDLYKLTNSVSRVY